MQITLKCIIMCIRKIKYNMLINATSFLHFKKKYI